MFCAKTFIWQAFGQKPTVAIIKTESPFCAAYQPNQGKLCRAEFEREVMEKYYCIVLSASQVENPAQVSRFEKCPGTVELPFIKSDDFIDEICVFDDGRS